MSIYFNFELRLSIKQKALILYLDFSKKEGRKKNQKKKKKKKKKGSKKKIKEIGEEKFINAKN
jgi:hypothetical protein